ncbi:MAG: tetratricopeptide repeat protein [Deltaproteobacteria bacterium]|nr:tetratricopeptide repeat protein [Deltaproteobacteria bacterium]
MVHVLRREFKQGVSSLDRAIEIYPKFAKGYYYRSVARARNGELDQALVDINEAIKIEPKEGNAYSLRGGILVSQEKWDRAIEDLTAALKYSHDSGLETEIYSNRTRAWLNRGKFDKAIEDSTEVIKRDPKAYDAYFKRGTAWATKGDYDKAIEDLTEGMKGEPDSWEAHYNRGSAWIGKGNLVKALEDLNDALRISPKNSRVLATRAKLLVMKQEFDRALADLNVAIDLEPRIKEAKNLGVLVLRIYIFMQKHEWDKAIADASEGIQLDPTEGAYYYARAGAYLYELKKGEELGQAMRDIDVAIRLKPDFAPSYVVRAEIWSRQGKIDKAKADMEKARSIDPASTTPENKLPGMDTLILPIENKAELNACLAMISRGDLRAAITKMGQYLKKGVDSHALIDSIAFARGGEWQRDATKIVGTNFDQETGGLDITLSSLLQSLGWSTHIGFREMFGGSGGSHGI